MTENKTPSERQKIYLRLAQNPFSLLEAGESVQTLEPAFLHFEMNFLDRMSMHLKEPTAREAFSHLIRMAFKDLDHGALTQEKQSKLIRSEAHLALENFSLEADEQVLSINSHWFLIEKKINEEERELSLKYYSQPGRLGTHPQWPVVKLKYKSITAQIEEQRYITLVYLVEVSRNQYELHYDKYSIDISIQASAGLKKTTTAFSVPSAIHFEASSTFFKTGNVVYLLAHECFFNERLQRYTYSLVLFRLPSFSRVRLELINNPTDTYDSTLGPGFFIPKIGPQESGLFVQNSDTGELSYYSSEQIKEHLHSRNKAQNYQTLSANPETLRPEAFPPWISHKIRAISPSKDGHISIEYTQNIISIIYGTSGNWPHDKLDIDTSSFGSPSVSRPHLALLGVVKKQWVIPASTQKPWLILSRIDSVSPNGPFFGPTVLIDLESKEIRMLPKEFNQRFLIEKTTHGWVLLNDLERGNSRRMFQFITLWNLSEAAPSPSP